ncbi:MAG: histidinol-phosphate aminotransferase family protein [Bacteroidetes bacterium]|nr:histidinol-phosphate aminotransferase family protein [Bacteroidota bacterium]
MISGHGDDRHQYQQAIRADFSSNVWFGGTPQELISHLQQNLHLIGRYPEPDAADLCRKIAALHNVNPNHVMAFNGSVEAFYTIAQAFREAVSAILYPAFAEYEDACRMHNHRLKFFRGNEGENMLKSGANLFWIGNPNNPDGHLFSISQIEEMLETYPDTVFVVDEAYAGLVPGFGSAIPLTRTYLNLMVVRSFTKCCAIPGLRLGYVIASEKLTNRLRKFQQPWSVNALAQEAGKFLLEHWAVNQPDTQEILKLSSGLQQTISHLEGFRIIQSKAPFFLIEMESGTATELKQFLLNEHQILIRDASNFRGLGKNYFRVCTRSESDNRLLEEGLKDWQQHLNFDFKALCLPNSSLSSRF